MLVFVLSPFGVKWLTDGMETSLAVLLALMLAATLDSERHRPIGAGMVALLCVLVRPELVALVAVTVVGQLVRSNRRLAMATALGGLVAVALLYGVFGSALVGCRGGQAALRLFADGIPGTARKRGRRRGLLGVGLALAWLGLMAITIRADGVRARSPARRTVVPAGAGRHRRARPGGRRHPAAAAVPRLLTGLRRGARRRCVPASPIRTRVLLPLAAVAVGIWTVDAFAFERIVRVQAQSMEAMRTRDWSALRGHTGVAWDVGYLAYFTKAPICDAQGLIDGPDFARLSLPERLRQCAEVADFAFVDPPRFHILTTALDMSGWRILRPLRLRPSQGPVNVYLIVAPQLAHEPLCPASAPRVDGVDPLRQAHGSAHAGSRRGSFALRRLRLDGRERIPARHAALAAR